MIKNYKDFKTTMEKELSKIEGYEAKIGNIKAYLTRKYKADIVRSIEKILNTILKKMGEDTTTNFLGLLRDDEDFGDLVDAMEGDIYFNTRDDKDCHLTGIIKDDDKWLFELHCGEDNEPTYELSTLSTITLYDLLNVLIEHTSAIFNADVLQKLNKTDD